MPAELRSTFGSNGQDISVTDLQNGPLRDSEALQGDWIVVGSDIRNAMNTVAWWLPEPKKSV